MAHYSITETLALADRVASAVEGALRPRPRRLKLITSPWGTVIQLAIEAATDEDVKAAVVAATRVADRETNLLERATARRASPQGAVLSIRLLPVRFEAGIECVLTQAAAIAV